MKPYYESDNGVLYHGDCLDVIPGLEQTDLTITSPPYDKLRNYNGFVFDYKKIARDLLKITAAGGVVVWIVGDSKVNGSETGTSFQHALYFKEVGFNIHDTMIYKKNGPAYPSKNQYYSIFEYMFVFSNGRPRVFNPIKDRLNKWHGQKWSKKRSRRNVSGELKSSDWDKNEGSKYGTRFNIWKYNVGANYSTKDKEAFKHPAIFPEALAQDHILSWSNPGDVVMDPMCGSGTTLKMAEINNRKWIGIEISEEYCEIAARRIEKETRQLKLFP